MKRINFRALIGYLLIIGIIVAIVTVLVPKVKNEMSNNKTTTQKANNNNKNNTASGELVRISIDEWIGYDSLLQANGGLKTKPDSIYGKKGLNIEIVPIQLAQDSSDALIKGEIQGAGYTVNRFAFLQDKFKNAGVQVVMPYITNYSNGGDGIIAKADVKSIEDLAGRKIGVTENSEAQTLVEWLIANSSLTAEKQQEIRNAMVFFKTPDEVAEAFFAGRLDAGATWEPFLTQAKTTTNCRVLFDTSMATNLILSGVTFRQDFLDTHEQFMKDFIDGSFEASAFYKKKFDAIRELSGFALMTDEDIMGMADGADLTTWKDNMSLLTNEGVTMYRDMAKIWNRIGLKAYPEDAEKVFTNKYMALLESKYSSLDYDNKKNENFSDEKKQQAQQIDNKEALMSQTLDIRFQPDSTVISEESYEVLNQFVETAKILDGVFIQIEGNTAKVPNSDGIEFSKKRANSVAKYLQAQGIDPNRFIIVGNGDTNPKGDNNTEEGKILNRRTDVFFKVVGY